MVVRIEGRGQTSSKISIIQKFTLLVSALPSTSLGGARKILVTESAVSLSILGRKLPKIRAWCSHGLARVRFHPGRESLLRKRIILKLLSHWICSIRPRVRLSLVVVRCVITLLCRVLGVVTEGSHLSYLVVKKLSAFVWEINDLNFFAEGRFF